ncbi:hypothetical protein J5N97_016501 [Dioscorea zingiberensis]|uniref:Uncharacterized protein n=1 Tax=Dioscorea zingiberensis TaxID=325984 RepID=A0A9D5HF86_9LILI|nr:hypothetical protein J5N97_016501 [Dioscorea zingiberensis]
MPMHVEDKMPVEERNSSMEELKVRKPYTISRPRERWTIEEHHRFLEALRLHGRAWRRIQEHIGTKTAVQIRSHAQKFFSKVMRESASGDGGNMKLIDIPPPRPKRKPMHPYPRKSGSIHERTSVLEPLQTFSSPITSASGPYNGSPTSVLSGAFRMQVSSPHEQDGNQDTYDLDAQEKVAMESDRSPDQAATSKECSSIETQAVSLRLFGRTVLVTDSHGPTSSSFGGKTIHQNTRKDLQNQTSTPSQVLERGDYYGDQIKIQWSCWPGFPSMVHCYPPHGDSENPSEMKFVPNPWLVYPLNFPFPSIHPQDISSEVASEDRHLEQEECSNTGSNTTSGTEMETPTEGRNNVVESKSVTHDKQEITHGHDAPTRGFVPYKS